MGSLPEYIDKFLEGSKVEEIGIGCSNTSVFKINKNNQIYFLKVGEKPLLTKEYASLIWLDGKLSVPKCVYFCNDGKKEYLLTTGMAGEMSCSERGLKNPEHTIVLLAKAIKQLQGVDILECPFRCDLNYKLGLAEYNVKNHLLKEKPLSDVGKKLKSYEKILEYLKSNKSKEELVFSHGDASLPNIFFNNDSVGGFIDVGECGVADKWFDIAICYKSIKRNFPDRKDLLDLFLTELGETYSSKIEFYITLMDLYL